MGPLAHRVSLSPLATPEALLQCRRTVGAAGQVGRPIDGLGFTGEL